MNRKQRNAAKMDYRQCRSIIAVECENFRKARWKANPVNIARHRARIKKIIECLSGQPWQRFAFAVLLRAFTAAAEELSQKFPDLGKTIAFKLPAASDAVKPDIITKDHFIDLKTQEQKT